MELVEELSRVVEARSHYLGRSGGDVDLASMAEFDAPSYDGDVQASDVSRRERRSSGGAWSAPTRSLWPHPSTTPPSPGALKNAIGWVSRFRPQPFNERHELLVSASPSMIGGNRGLWGVAHTLRVSRRSSLSGPVLARPGAQSVRHGRADRERAAPGALRYQRRELHGLGRGIQALPLHQTRGGNASASSLTPPSIASSDAPCSVATVRALAEEEAGSAGISTGKVLGPEPADVMP